MSKPHIWRRRREWVCGHVFKTQEWGTGQTPTEALRHWCLGQMARLRVLGRFGGGRFGQ